MQDLDLIALISSRLCHDLVSPVGAVANGVEIMAEEDDPAMQKQALELLAHSAELASRRLKFYRMAFGASGGEGMRISLRDARQAASEFLADGRVKLRWPDDIDEDALNPSKTAVKLLLNFVLLAAEAMPRGGEVVVALERDGDLRLNVQARGVGVRLGETLSLAFGSGQAAPDIAPKTAPALLAARLAAGIGGTLDADLNSDVLTLSAKLPVNSTG